MKRQLLSLARRAHIPPPVYPPRPAPTPPGPKVLAEPQEPDGLAVDALEQPEPAPERKPKPESLGRIVRRSPKWFDPAR